MRSWFGRTDQLELGLNSTVTLGGDKVNVKMGGGNDTLFVGDTSGNPAASILLHGNGGEDSRNDFPEGIATIKSFEIVIV